jgi:hypothetical protein
MTPPATAEGGGAVIEKGPSAELTPPSHAPNMAVRRITNEDGI